MQQDQQHTTSIDLNLKKDPASTLPETPLYISMIGKPVPQIAHAEDVLPPPAMQHHAPSTMSKPKPKPEQFAPPVLYMNTLPRLGIAFGTPSQTPHHGHPSNYIPHEAIQATISGLNVQKNQPRAAVDDTNYYLSPVSCRPATPPQTVLAASMVNRPPLAQAPPDMYSPSSLNQDGVYEELPEYIGTASTQSRSSRPSLANKHIMLSQLYDSELITTKFKYLFRNKVVSQAALRRRVVLWHHLTRRKWELFVLGFNLGVTLVFFLIRILMPLYGYLPELALLQGTFIVSSLGLCSFILYDFFAKLAEYKALKFSGWFHYPGLILAIVNGIVGLFLLFIFVNSGTRSLWNTLGDLSYVYSNSTPYRLTSLCIVPRITLLLFCVYTQYIVVYGIRAHRTKRSMMMAAIIGAMLLFSCIISCALLYKAYTTLNIDFNPGATISTATVLNFVVDSTHSLSQTNDLFSICTTIYYGIGLLAIAIVFCASYALGMFSLLTYVTYSDKLSNDVKDAVFKWALAIFIAGCFGSCLVNSFLTSHTIYRMFSVILERLGQTTTP
ncbi:hypothetical protein NEDG_01675 [Nematocida displodere]|uniref:Uncharacterized protein n=1 Tax=Nematocida displodere TaxID=1805483 RepID=A0A177EJF5_9MICR|nr:hypothetical protein NEDG_01675 [Nematocida displodere]